MDGLVYLLNQSGIALSQANDRINELTRLLEAQNAQQQEGTVNDDAETV